MSEKEKRVSHYFRNVLDEDVKKLRDDENKIEFKCESTQTRLKPEKYSEASKEAINDLDFYLEKWNQSVCNPSDPKMIEGFKNCLIRWLLCNPYITTNQLSKDTLELLNEFDRYYKRNKYNQMIF